MLTLLLHWTCRAIFRVARPESAKGVVHDACHCWFVEQWKIFAIGYDLILAAARG